MRPYLMAEPLNPTIPPPRCRPPTRTLQGWNVFDFCIVVTAWLPFFITADGLGALKLLRLLRLFRILRLVHFLPQLQVR